MVRKEINRICDRRLHKKRKEFLLDFKRNRSCVFCGWDEHIEIKEMGITSRYSIKKLKEEMKKCILLCPNCHYWYHYKEYQK